MAKTVMYRGDSISFKLRQIFDLTAKVEEDLATCWNLRLLLVCRHNSYISRYGQPFRFVDSDAGI